jgi:hypothetical protein
MPKRSSHPLLSCTDGLAADWADFVQLVGRILLGQLFILIGWTKLTGYAFYVTYFTALKVPYPDIWPWPIGILELQCKKACPLYPQKRTCAVQLGMSAKCQ